MSQNVLDILKERGFIEQTTDEDNLRETLSTPTTCYIGFDPTAPTLHAGSLVPIMALARGGQMNQSLLDLVRANVREPVQVEGDLYSLAACNETGSRRLLEMMAEFELGPDKLKSVLCFDGTPISARNIRKQILQMTPGHNVRQLHPEQTASGAGDQA